MEEEEGGGRGGGEGGGGDFIVRNDTSGKEGEGDKKRPQPKGISTEVLF